MYYNSYWIFILNLTKLQAILQGFISNSYGTRLVIVPPTCHSCPSLPFPLLPCPPWLRSCRGGGEAGRAGQGRRLSRWLPCWGSPPKVSRAGGEAGRAGGLPLLPCSFAATTPPQPTPYGREGRAGQGG